MSQGMSPYQSPQSEMSPETVQSANVSIVPKVFGILHLVFGGLGLVMGVIGLASIAFKDKMQEMQFAAHPKEVREKMKEAMQPLYETQIWDVVSGVGSMILAVLLIIAGLKLIKYRSQGRSISNIYSGLSILHKLFGLVILLLVKAPLMKEVGESFDRMGGQTNASMEAIMGPTVIVMGIISAVVMMVYPVLSFFMLSKKQVKDSLN